MAVFGAPTAHEDDAERAVRAGLRVLGINTGEAVVALGARPEEGEGIVTGDVVNTTSRLQSAAPVNGTAVSEQTYRQTERVFDYEELAPVQVKGKAEPLAADSPAVLVFEDLHWADEALLSFLEQPLLGEGRCLTTLGKPEAEAPLREARELFASMGYKPALAETEALLTHGEAAAAV
jgi:Adenylate and Guanylate cyclase catalytic domain